MAAVDAADLPDLVARIAISSEAFDGFAPALSSSALTGSDPALDADGCRSLAEALSGGAGPALGRVMQWATANELDGSSTANLVDLVLRVLSRSSALHQRWGAMIRAYAVRGKSINSAVASHNCLTVH